MTADTHRTASDLIAALDLRRHPEGGWYRETWRADAPDGGRGAGTAILFLLGADERSHWHKVDASEVWLWHAGGPLLLHIAADDAGPVSTVRLGPDILAGEMPQHVIAPYHWQAAEVPGGWALMSCIVAPGFSFSGFTLAQPAWAPGAGPGPADADRRKSVERVKGIEPSS